MFDESVVKIEVVKMGRKDFNFCVNDEVIKSEEILEREEERGEENVVEGGNDKEI